MLKSVYLILTMNLAVAAAAQSIGVETNATSIRFSGVQPGSGLAVVGASTQNERSFPTTRRFIEVLNDSDRDGVIEYEPRGGVPVRSMWIAVELESGRIAIAAHPEFTIRDMSLSRHVLKKDASDSPFALEDERRRLDLIIVRPGHGAWSVLEIDGGPKDKDGASNGKMTLAFDDGKPLDPAWGKAPKNLKRGDVIAAVDPARMQLLTVTIDK